MYTQNLVIKHIYVKYIYNVYIAHKCVFHKRDNPWSFDLFLYLSASKFQCILYAIRTLKEKFNLFAVC